jgi:hypothetical protein
VIVTGGERGPPDHQEAGQHPQDRRRLWRCPQTMLLGTVKGELGAR